MSKYTDADKQKEIMKQNDEDYDSFVCFTRCNNCKYYKYGECTDGVTYATQNFYWEYGCRREPK